MSALMAQVSLYPLRQPTLGPAIRQAVRTFREHGLGTRIGEMSTLVWGEEAAVFAALQQAFTQAARQGGVVMVLTVSNACPRPGPGTGLSPELR